eukprot:6441473-Amphidinium_carterae.1
MALGQRTAAFAVYPPELNKAMAKAIANSTAVQVSCGHAFAQSVEHLKNFGGRANREDGLASFLKDVGAEIDNLLQSML